MLSKMRGIQCVLTTHYKTSCEPNSLLLIIDLINLPLQKLGTSLSVCCRGVEGDVRAERAQLPKKMD
jgi:hypothetical protein